MVALTKEQATTLLAFCECFDLHTTGAWPAIDAAMREDYDVADPEGALEDATDALREG